jgi:hypothetical protein
MAAGNVIFAAAFAELLTRAALVDFASDARFLRTRSLRIKHLVVAARAKARCVSLKFLSVSTFLLMPISFLRAIRFGPDA